MITQIPCAAARDDAGQCRVAWGVVLRHPTRSRIDFYLQWVELYLAKWGELGSGGEHLDKRK